MEETTIGTDLLAGIVKMILHNFVEAWTSKSKSQEAVYNHIDVTLSKLEGRGYSVQVTNYGSSTSNVLKFATDVFCNSISAGIFPQDVSIAMVYTKSQHNERETVHDLLLTKNSLSLLENATNEKLDNSPYWKEYLSFKLKYTLDSREIERFKEIVLSEIVFQQRFVINLKFTFRQNDKVLYQNRIALDDEHASCQALSAALTSIIRKSSCTEFKEMCFAMLRVDNSHQTEEALMAKLLPMLHGNYVRANETETS